MAQFNIPVNPTQSPSFMGYSKPISQPEADKTYETLLKGVGNIAEAGIKGADAIVKDRIDKEVTATFMPEQEKFIRYMEHQEGVTGGVAPFDILPKDTGEAQVPDAVKNVAQSAVKIKSGHEAGLPDLYYKGRLYGLARSLINQYPGYGPYIRQQITQAVGIDPLNAYGRELVSQHERRAAAGKSEMDRAYSLLTKHIGTPGADQMFSALQRGEIDTGVIFREVSKYEQQEEELKRRKLHRDERQGSREDMSLQAKDDADYELNATIDKINSSILINSGLFTPEKASQFLVDLAAGRMPKATEEEIRKVGEMMRAQRPMVYQALRKILDKPVQGNRSYGSLMGPTETENLIKSKMGVYDEIQKAFYDGDAGAVNRHKNAVAAKVNNTQYQLLQTDLGKHMLMSKAFKDFGGDQASNYYITRLISGGNLPAQVKHFMEHNMAAIMTPPQDPTQIMTPKKAIETLRQQQRLNPMLPKEAFGVFTRFPEMVADPKVDDKFKKNIVDNIYHRDNLGYISLWSRTGRDPKTGRSVISQTNQYLAHTSPAVVKEVKRLSADNPQRWSNFEGWGVHTAINELLGPDIEALKEIPMSPNFKMGWDDVNTRFNLELTKRPTRTSDEDFGPISEAQIGRMQRANTVPGYDQAKATVERINLVISGLANIAKEGGQDPSIYIFEALRARGYTPDNAKNPVNLPDHLMRSLIEQRVRTMFQKGQGVQGSPSGFKGNQ